jgi:hypothetical protein
MRKSKRAVKLIASSAELYRDSEEPYIKAHLVRCSCQLEIELDPFNSLVVRPLYGSEEETIELRARQAHRYSDYTVLVPASVLDGQPKPHIPTEGQWIAHAKVTGAHGTFEARLVQGEDYEVFGRLTLEVSTPDWPRLAIRIHPYRSDCVSLRAVNEKLVKVDLPHRAFELD